MFEGFMNPALAAGAALAAVPLIIHLLNRQRHKPVRWAAMRFVLAAYKKTRRRVQLENLLLLLLRMAAIALLALAVARPFASRDSLVGGLTESRRDLVLVLDGSASTGYSEDVTTVFERIVERATELVSDMDGPKGDRVHVILAGRHPRLIAWPTPEKANAVLGTLLTPTDESLDLAAALGEVLRLVQQDAAGTGTSTLEVRLLTDLQRRTFAGANLEVNEDGEARAEGAPALLSEQLDALQEFGVRLLVEDHGPAPLTPPNLSIEDVLVLEDAASAGALVEVAVRVANHGPSAQPAVRVGLSVNGNRHPSQRIDVPAQGRAEAVFSVQFEQAGAHALEADIDGDRLVVDDRRASVVLVPPPVRILLVNGNQADELLDDEVGFLTLALEAPEDVGGAAAPFLTREITPPQLGTPDVNLAEFDVIWLANVGPLSDALVTQLEERVAIGASLIVSCGDRMGDLGTINDKLYAADGSGLLPAELVRKVSSVRRSNYYRARTFDDLHPALSFFASELHRPLFTEVPYYDFIHCRPLDSARVLARLDDDAQSPLFVERAYVDGKVFLWTSSIGRAWTLLPQLASPMIPLTLEWMRYAGEAQLVTRDLEPGAAVRVEVPAFPRTPELVRPDATRRAVDGDPEETPRGSYLLPQLGGADTERAGLYVIALEGQRDEPFAVQLDAAESDLLRIGSEELAALHPALVPLSVDGDAGAPDPTDPRRGELWRWAALACLLALVAESLWGAWVGQRRRVRA